MLQGILTSTSRTSIRDAESILRQRWASVLKLKGEAQARFCAATESFLTEQLAKRPVPSDVLAIFTTIYMTAAHAIHSGLAAPVRWTTAQNSPFRRSMHVERAPPSRTEAAQVVVSVCERLLLPNVKVAGACFSKLLRETAMGVPLLALVLRAYGEAAVHLLSAHSEGPQYLQSCIDHLVLATYTFTDAMSDDALTIAHPILLHVACLSGRTQDAMQLLRRPIFSVNPMLTGIGLSDYVAYHAEAALLLAALEQYESAMYALVPVNRLFPTGGTREDAIGSRGEAGDGGLPPWLNGLENEEADLHDAVPHSGGWAADACQDPATGADSAHSVRHSALLYPWYRTECVGETRKYVRSTEAKNRTAEVNGRVWRNIFVPSAVEREIDRHAVAWANRLGLVLLAAAFGGGSPHGVMTLIEPVGRRIVDDEEVPSIWTGTASAIAGHVCFPHPLFGLLTETTPVSLRPFVHFVTANRTTSTRAYTDLLVAIARRDTESAQQCLDNPANVALFTEDLTVDLVRTTVLRALPRHILLDVARMYTHIPMQMLLDRTQLSRTDAKTNATTPENKRAEDEKSLDAATMSSTHTLVQLLVKMCATGDLAFSHVYITATPDASEAAKEHATFYPVEEVARQLDSGTASFSVSTASVKWALPSSAARLQRCAQVVQFHVHNPPVEGLDVSLVPMLAQLRELQRVVDADAEEIRGMGIV
ncbi:hypothetical protein, conserved [Leishmania tarentolae]|uniref:Uncharacterized protein n=1 Tax=Leishmania tarentolae TaxID=5689 RepID=A0A640KUK6_LEITA|nr:hypothetical protein, conserved [Leishmania tarentolae]